MAEAKTKAKKAPAKKAVSKEEKPVAKAATKKAPKADHSSEYAIFATGGKQYRVSAGDSVKIEKLQGKHKEGDKLTFDKVLLVDNGTDASIGTPYITGASIDATIKKISRYKTIDVIKYKQKSRYFKKNGHRQPYFEITINAIK